MSVQSAVLQWRTRLHELESACFWPGPRSMEDPETQDLQLLGRDDDATAMTDKVLAHSLVVLSGESGVGKSSFLNVKIARRLENAGFTVIVCREWSSDGSAASDIGAFIANKVSAQLPSGIQPSAQFLIDLDDMYGNSAVLVLDQFEELIRHQPRLFEEVSQWITTAMASLSIRVVISLRSEFTHRLRYLRVGPFQRADHELAPISDKKTVTEIIASGKNFSDSDTETITADAAQEIVRIWEDADGGKPWSGVGLLHLQALLYVLWRECKGTTVTNDDLMRIKERAEVAAARQREVQSVFDFALAYAVGLRLDRCEEEFLKGSAADRALAVGAKQLIARMARHLSSGGYKLDQDRRHLAALALGDELETLGVAGTMVATVLREMEQSVDLERQHWRRSQRAQSEYSLAPGVDWLIACRREIAATLDVNERQQDPWENDPFDVTSGGMMGLTPLSVVGEELRRLLFALEWMYMSDLVRFTSPEEGRTIVTLIHDGFGRGLNDWAESNADRATTALNRLTAAVGESLTWDEPVDGTVDAEGQASASGSRLVVNQRWKSCRISGTFRAIVFMNCDFRNSSFVNCDLTGVTFVNCLLDGVTVVDSTINGAVGPIDPSSAGSSGRGQLPAFAHWDPAAAVELSRYREELPTAEWLYSETSGLPAVPRIAPTGEEFPFTMHAGGLAVYGGRLSSLMFGKCVFADDAMLSLRHVAGTSLEFAEQSEGRIQLYDVAIRGLTISASVEDDSDDRDASNIEITAEKAVLQNVWFSSDLHGSASFSDSRIWQLFNGTKDDFTVSVSNSAYHGLWNTQPPRDDSAPEKEFEEGMTVAAAKLIRTTALKVDYRRSPAQFERKLRDATLSEPTEEQLE